MLNDVLKVGALLLFVFVACACDREKRDIFLIPEHFNGWVCVHYGKVDSKELSYEDGFRVVKVPESGIVETSSPGIPGVGYVDKEFFVAKDGHRYPVPSSYKGGGGTHSRLSWSTSEYIFIFWIGLDHSNQNNPPPLSSGPEGVNCGPR